MKQLFFTLLCSFVFVWCNGQKILVQEVTPMVNKGCLDVEVKGNIANLREVFEQSDATSAVMNYGENKSYPLRIKNIKFSTKNDQEYIDIGADDYCLVIDIGPSFKDEYKEPLIATLRTLSKYYFDKRISDGALTSIYLLGNSLFPLLKASERQTYSHIRDFQIIENSIRTIIPNSFCSLNKLESLAEGSKKIIFISDGFSSLNISEEQNALTQDLVGNLKSKLSETLSFFPIPYSSSYNRLFLNQVSSYAYDKKPFQIPVKLKNKSIPADELFLHLELYPLNTEDRSQHIFGPEKRSLVLTFIDKSKSVTQLSKGTFFGGENMYYKKPGFETFWKTVAIGMGLLMILFFIVPVINRFRFKQKHIFKYADIKKPGTAKFDPITKNPFECDDMVVVVGEEMMSLDTWKSLSQKRGSESYEKHEAFFINKLEGTVFDQYDTAFRPVYWFFFMLAGFLLFWTIYSGLGVFFGDRIDAIESEISSNFPNLKHVPLFRLFLFGSLFMTFTYVASWVAIEISNVKNIALTDVLQNLFLVSIAFIASLASIHYIFSELIPNNYAIWMASWAVTSLWVSFVFYHYFPLTTKNILMYIVFTTLLISGLYFLHYHFVPSLLPMEVVFFISLVILAVGITHLLAITPTDSEYYGIVFMSPEEAQNKVYSLHSSDKDIFEMGQWFEKHDIYMHWVDPKIKKRHCKIKRKQSAYFIEPLDGEVWMGKSEVKESSKLRKDVTYSFGPDSLTEFVFESYDSLAALNKAIALNAKGKKDMNKKSIEGYQS